MKHKMQNKYGSAAFLNARAQSTIRGGIIRGRDWHTCASTCEIHPDLFACIDSCPYDINAQGNGCVRGLYTFYYC
jgi:hypothetical protein